MISQPSWLNEAVLYQIYPSSFQDSNGDGMGDLPGICSRLDYLKSLGINTLWLSPCFCSPFRDGGYDITDFFQVDPRYGTNEDLFELFTEAEKRGIRVLMDLVAGHTSDEHPWFRNAVSDPDHPDADRYIWKSRDFDPDAGPDTTHYAHNFFDFQPALNFGYVDRTEPWQQAPDDPGPRKNIQSLIDIMDFWMNHGAAGFRVDMASSLVKQDPGLKATCAIWREIRSWFDEHYPECALLAEWSEPAVSIPAGFHADFLIHFHCDIYRSLFFNEVGTLPYPDGICYFHDSGEGEPWFFLDGYQRQLEAIEGNGVISLPTSNHDFQRLRCGSRDWDQLLAPWVFLLTQKGIPTIYQGEEIGMRFVADTLPKEGSTLVGVLPPNAGTTSGERAGSRTPMQWDASRNAGFSSTSSEEDMYLPLDPDPDRPTVEAQEKDPHSLLHQVRELIRLRNKRPELGAGGTYEPMMSRDTAYPLVILRRLEDQAGLIVINPSGTKVEVALPSGCHVGSCLFGRGVKCVEGDEPQVLKCDPYAAALFDVS